MDLASQGKQTLQIIDRGFYISATGRRVDVRATVDASVAGTRLYRFEDLPDGYGMDRAGGFETNFEVTNETTLSAARRLVDEGVNDVVCLNFASAKNPGGGCLGGARAQEESLARSSGLYASIAPMQEMYNFNRSYGSCLYSDYMIYSPRVPVFRDDRGTLLEASYLASFVTSPAVNAGAVARNEPQNVKFIESTMAGRVDKVLWTMCQEGHSTVVLGAWGCGVFRNDPSMVARLFFNALRTTFAGRFARVVFAVLDTSEDGRVIGPFRRHV